MTTKTGSSVVLTGLSSTASGKITLIAGIVTWGPSLSVKGAWSSTIYAGSVSGAPSKSGAASGGSLGLAAVAAVATGMSAVVPTNSRNINEEPCIVTIGTRNDTALKAKGPRD